MAGTPLFVQVPANSTGEKLQVWQNTIGGNAVDTEAVTLTDSSGVEKATAGNPARVDPTGTTVQPVSIGATTTSGCLVYHVVSGASTNAATIKGSAGQVYGYSIMNNTTYPIFVKLFNETSTPDPTADTVIQSIGVQAGVSRDFFSSTGIAYGTGIGIAIVKGIADNNGTAVAASDCTVDILYK